MHLQELIKDFQTSTNTSVPEWMIGGFKRRSITFANGLTDTQTNVYWLQSRNLTIDLRLPVQSEQVTEKDLDLAPENALLKMCDYEGWSADSVWDNEQLSWNGGTCFQVHNRWPEAAELKRIGDCMIEFAPSGAYVEDWRLLSHTPGPLVGLKLIEETDMTTGETQHRDGALIINGEWAGLVLGRPQPLPNNTSEKNTQLRDLVQNNKQDSVWLRYLSQFETSIAIGNLGGGFKVSASLHPARIGQNLFDLDGFEFGKYPNEIVHIFKHDSRTLKRKFTIDSIESRFNFTSQTQMTETAKYWFERERQTLGRYLTSTL